MRGQVDGGERPAQRPLERERVERAGQRGETQLVQTQAEAQVTIRATPLGQRDLLQLDMTVEQRKVQGAIETDRVARHDQSSVERRKLQSADPESLVGQRSRCARIR